MQLLNLNWLSFEFADFDYRSVAPILVFCAINIRNDLNIPVKKNAYSIVSQDQAKQIPYPYIYINADGSYRELTKEEREYLETEFYPTDGDRPYIKAKYDDFTPDGKMDGFLAREKYPSHLEDLEIHLSFFGKIRYMFIRLFRK